MRRLSRRFTGSASQVPGTAGRAVEGRVKGASSDPPGLSLYTEPLESFSWPASLLWLSGFLPGSSRTRSPIYPLSVRSSGFDARHTLLIDGSLWIFGRPSMTDALFISLSRYIGLFYSSILSTIIFGETWALTNLDVHGFPLCT